MSFLLEAREYSYAWEPASTELFLIGGASLLLRRAWLRLV